MNVMTKDPWKTSVDELMRLFCEALSSMLPSLRKAHLVDENLNGYDGWDAITESLFSAMVESSIQWSLPEAESDSFKLPKYGFTLPTLKGQSYIAVIGHDPQLARKSFAFLSLAPSSNPAGFPGMVKAVEVMLGGEPGGERLFPFSDVSFVCRVAAKGSTRELSDLEVRN